MNSSLMRFEDALERLIGAAIPLTDVEQVPSHEALDRVLAADLVSAVDVPPLDNAAMDGYAVRLVDLASKLPLDVSQRIVAGQVGLPLHAGSVARIMTGAPVPEGAEAVVMQEDCVVDGSKVSIHRDAVLGENIRHRGDDVRVGSMVLARGSRLGAAELGVAASIGIAVLPVIRRLRVALFSTGDELTMPGDVLEAGGIYNSNRATLLALLQGMGCSVTDLGIVPDDLATTRHVLRDAAASHDLILTSGGVSVGEEDHVKQAVAAEGEISVWKLAIKPGKPLAFGRISPVGAGDTLMSTSAAFIGLPGNPVASFVTFLMLVRPYIHACQSARVLPARRQSLRADFSWPGDKRREFLRVRRNADDGLDLFPNQSSGVLTSCAWADGLVSNPPGCAIAVGDMVTFTAFSELMYA